MEGNVNVRSPQEDGDEGEGAAAADAGVLMHPAMSAVNITAVKHSSSMENPAMSTANMAALHASSSMPTATGAMQSFDTNGSMADIMGGTAGNFDPSAGTNDWVNVFAKFGVDYDGNDTAGAFAETGGGGTDGPFYEPGGASTGGTGGTGDYDYGHDEPSYF